MPTHPDVERGFTFSIIIHGQTVYFSSYYDTAYKALFWGAPTLFAPAMVIDFYKEPFNQRGTRR